MQFGQFLVFLLSQMWAVKYVIWNILVLSCICHYVLALEFVKMGNLKRFECHVGPASMLVQLCLKLSNSRNVICMRHAGVFAWLVITRLTRGSVVVKVSVDWMDT